MQEKVISIDSYIIHINVNFQLFLKHFTNLLSINRFQQIKVEMIRKNNFNLIYDSYKDSNRRTFL